MIECLLAIQEEKKASQEQMIAKMDAHGEQMRANQEEMIAEMKSH
jgi:hypothetical protein